MVPPPSILTRYTKAKPIGTGTFGACFLAKDVHSGETCVMKEVRLQGMDAKEVKRSINEAKVLQKLKHQNLISYRDAQVNRGDKKLYIVMEHAAGGDLGGLIAERTRSGRRFSEDECLKVIAQSCSALAYCHHQLYLLHRDIKPQNIFLSSAHPGPHGRTPGDVKIGDFGISAELSASHGLAMTKCGSPVYMSPELCSGRPYDRGCDVWALGCVLFEMMSLTTPWLNQLPKQHGLLALMRLVCSGSLDVTPLRRHYSDDLVALLAAMLCKQPQHRPSFRKVLQFPIIQRTLRRLYPETTPPISPVSTPPLSPVSDPEEATATGDSQPQPSAASPTAAYAAPPPAFAMPPRPARVSAAAAAAKHVNIYEELTRPGRNYAPGANPFNARSPPPAKARFARPYGVDAHAAALAVQRSFHARRRAQAPMRAAGMPSRPPARPAWVMIR